MATYQLDDAQVRALRRASDYINGALWAVIPLLQQQGEGAERRRPVRSDLVEALHYIIDADNSLLELLGKRGRAATPAQWERLAEADAEVWEAEGSLKVVQGGREDG